MGHPANTTLRGRFIVNTTSRFQPVAVLLMAAFASHAALDSGMVLLKTIYEGASGSTGKLEIVFLSTMDTLVLQDGGVKNGRFSPDGQKVCFDASSGEWGHVLYTVNIDGTDKRQICNEVDGMHPCWSTDGYIYLTGVGEPSVNRVSANGGAMQTVWTEPFGTRHQAKDGTWVGNNIYEGWVSLDGTKAIGTVSRYQSQTGGSVISYAQLNINLTTGQAFSYAQPCQSGIAPSGNTFSVSTYGHTVFRRVPWDTPYQSWDFGDTYSGCEEEGTEYAIGGSSAFTCPGFDDALLLGPDLQRIYGLPSGFNNIPVIGIPNWSSTDEDIFLFYSSGPVNGITDGAWVRRISTGEYLKVGNGVLTRANDFYPREIRAIQPYTLAPGSVQFTYEPGGVVPAAKTVSLRSQNTMASAPNVSGTPNWLQVAVSPNGAREFVLTNSLVSSNLPGTGSYPVTITVTPAGTTVQLTYSVELVVGEPPPSPIVIDSPSGNTTYTLGDTLHVLFSAQNPPISGTLVSLTTDGGEYYTTLHSGASYESGDSVVLDYVLTPQVLGAQSSSANCIVRVSAYPTGFETYTEQFSIASPAQTSTGARPAAPRRGVSRVSVVPTPVGLQVRIRSAAGQTVQSYSVNGQAVRRTNTPRFGCSN